MSVTFQGRVTTPDVGNLTNVTGAYTPTVGSLQFVFATVEGDTADRSLTNSAGVTFTQVRKELFRASASALYFYIADTLTPSAISQTVTINGSGSGSIIDVSEANGTPRLNRAGTVAIRQQAGQSNQAAAGTPSPSFSASTQPFGFVLGAVANATNPAGLTMPTDFVGEIADTGYTTGAVHGLETTAGTPPSLTTVTWASTSASAFATIIIEIDVSYVPDLNASVWISRLT